MKIQALSAHPRADGEVLSRQNISGASQQNSVPVFTFLSVGVRGVDRQTELNPLGVNLSFKISEGWCDLCHDLSIVSIQRLKSLEKKQAGTSIRQSWSDVMCGYRYTPCINISLTPLVASRKRQIASSCLCNLPFC